MSKHTPEPWIYGVRKDGSMWLSCGDRTGKGEHYQSDFHGSEANARLVCAAPELLKALRSLVVRFERAIIASGSDPEYAALAVENERALIAKAEGKSP